MNVTMQFSIPAPRFTTEQQEAFSTFGQWTIIAERGGLLFIDGIGPEDNLNAALSALASMGRSAKIIGVWYEDGTKHPDYIIDNAEFAKVAPDKFDENGKALPRPTTFTEIHQWAGWPAKELE